MTPGPLHVPSGSANVSAAAKESSSGNMDRLGLPGKGAAQQSSERESTRPRMQKMRAAIVDGTEYVESRSERFARENAIVENPNHPDRRSLTTEEFDRIKHRVHCRNYRTRLEQLSSPSLDSMDSDPLEQPTEAELEEMYRKNPKSIKDSRKRKVIKDRSDARTRRARARQSGNEEASGAGHENA
ncbi:hypothetical protein QFC24_003865 [Naganishia onofrii]|uniref:Uncharacterized protein n=1 Tax=Naganishia onofrii TaxID=1851511 RepID=A0ACC2XFK6_9TREE|nr:hypothetical protein QFC24_003865 [Naganishia onofrii]